MTIVVGYVPTREGAAALDRAISDAARLEEDLVVVTSASLPAGADERLSIEILGDALDDRLAAAGIPHTIRQLTSGEDAADVILDLAQEKAASTIVIGVRRRSPVGKLLLGSASQRILLEADCPVVAVKG